MGNLLFSPSGRIGPSDFMKGMMVLAILAAIFSLTGLISFSLSQILGFASFLLVIPLFFLLVKRSHDSGKSGWMSIVWFILWLVIWLIMATIMNKIMPAAAEADLKAAMEGVIADGGGLGEIVSITKEFGPTIAKQTAIPSALAGLIGTGAAAFLINMFNKRDDHENQYGPAS